MLLYSFPSLPPPPFFWGGGRGQGWERFGGKGGRGLFDGVKVKKRCTIDYGLRCWFISRVSDQIGVFLLYIMLEIHHSGREPLLSLGFFLSLCSFGWLSDSCLVGWLLCLFAYLGFVCFVCVLFLLLLLLFFVCSVSFREYPPPPPPTPLFFLLIFIII